MAGELIVMLGPPGAGKSVQSRWLSQYLGWERIASGEVLRASPDPELQKTIQAGKLPSSEKVEEALIGYLRAVPAERGIVLDGFPRLLPEATWLDQQMPRLKRRTRLVLHLKLSRDLSVSRLTARGRGDDTPGVIATRWDEYEANTHEVLEYYRPRRIVREIDGSGSVAQVSQLLEATLAG